ADPFPTLVASRFLAWTRRGPPRPPRFPYTTLFRSSQSTPVDGLRLMEDFLQTFPQINGVYNGADSTAVGAAQAVVSAGKAGSIRSEEHTSELQSRVDIVCRLLLERKKKPVCHRACR